MPCASAGSCGVTKAGASAGNGAQGLHWSQLNSHGCCQGRPLPSSRSPTTTMLGPLAMSCPLGCLWERRQHTLSCEGRGRTTTHFPISTPPPSPDTGCGEWAGSENCPHSPWVPPAPCGFPPSCTTPPRTAQPRATHTPSALPCPSRTLPGSQPHRAHPGSPAWLLHTPPQPQSTPQQHPHGPQLLAPTFPARLHSPKPLSVLQSCGCTFLLSPEHTDPQPPHSRCPRWDPAAPTALLGQHQVYLGSNSFRSRALAPTRLQEEETPGRAGSQRSGGGSAQGRLWANRSAQGCRRERGDRRC